MFLVHFRIPLLTASCRKSNSTCPREHFGMFPVVGPVDTPPPGRFEEKTRVIKDQSVKITCRDTLSELTPDRTVRHSIQDMSVGTGLSPESAVRTHHQSGCENESFPGLE